MRKSVRDTTDGTAQRLERGESVRTPHFSTHPQSQQLARAPLHPASKAMGTRLVTSEQRLMTSSSWQEQLRGLGKIR